MRFYTLKFDTSPDYSELRINFRSNNLTFRKKHSSVTQRTGNQTEPEPNQDFIFKNQTLKTGPMD